MEQGVKRHILGLLDTGHRHNEMTKMLRCDYCGNRFKKAEKEYNRLRRQYPEKFIRKEPDEGFSKKTQNLSDMLDERIKQDKLYREHLRLLAFGTQEEKIRENKREMRGFYEKHTGDYRRKIL